jgi:hypothetical protein
MEVVGLGPGTDVIIFFNRPIFKRHFLQNFVYYIAFRENRQIYLQKLTIIAENSEHSIYPSWMHWPQWNKMLCQVEAKTIQTQIKRLIISNIVCKIVFSLFLHKYPKVNEIIITKSNI